MCIFPREETGNSVQAADIEGQKPVRKGKHMRFRPVLRLGHFTIGATVALIMASCGSGGSKEGEPSREVTELVRYYQEMKVLGQTGQVEQFLNMRDSVTSAEIRAYSRMKRWRIDSVRVAGWTNTWPDVAGLPLEQDSINGLWRRLAFRECGKLDKYGKEQCLYSVIMFHKDGAKWKVSNASRMASYRYNPDGSLCTLNQLNFQEMFRLPPSFEDLKPKPDSLKTAPVPLPVKIDPAGNKR
jgi:hypothetical protein